MYPLLLGYREEEQLAVTGERMFTKCWLIESGRLVQDQ